MAFVGVDVGAKTVKVLVIDGKRKVGSLSSVGFDEKEAVRKAFDGALRKAGLERGDIERVVATGVGRGVVTRL